MKIQQKIIIKLAAFCLFCALFAACASYIGSDAIDKFINQQRAKHSVPELSQTQMYADFDTLISIVERCNPQCLIRKKVTGYDLVAEMKTQRANIPNCKTTYDFIRLLSRTFELSLDAHCLPNAGIGAWMYSHSLYKKDIKINKIKERDFGINFHYTYDIFYQEPWQLPLLRVQNKYVLQYTTTLFLEDKDSCVLPLGTEILTFNQQPINEVQSKHRTHSTVWDWETKTYYNLYLPLADAQNKISFLVDGIEKDYVFSTFSRDRDDYWKRIKYRVKWFARDSILFITIPAMNYEKNMMAQLKSDILQHQDKPISSIIVDIRGNSGGDDQTWRDLLGMLTTEAFEVSYCYLSTTDKDVYRRLPPEKKAFKNVRRTLDFVDPNYTFRVLEEGTTNIKTDAQNLGYDGTIYVLVDKDIYSSAGSFSSLSTTNRRIKTVGMNTGVLLGQGATPSLFILPHSRLIFQMELMSDASNVSTAEDFYHDKVTYPLTPSPAYYRYWYDVERSYEIDETAMYERDEVFIEALKIIKKQR